MAIYGNFIDQAGVCKSGVVDCQTTATPIRVDKHTNLSSRHAVVVTAPAGATLYIGDSKVTSASGIPVAAGDTLIIPATSSNDIYMAASKACKVPVTEMSR